MVVGRGVLLGEQIGALAHEAAKGEPERVD